MGSERWRRRLAAVALGAVLAALAPAPAPAAGAAEPWWVPLGLRGQAVTALEMASSGVMVLAGGRTRCVALPGGPTPPRCAPPPRRPGAGFTLRGGRVLHRGRVDPGSPDLGAAARLIAAPAELPGVAVAVAADGTVWRRTAAGAWGRSLLLLPRSLLEGPPAITSLAAFDTADLSPTVYLGTDGYAVLITTDGGDDWTRAAPGLPAGVLCLAADAATRAVYAGTRDGLWVHHLRSIPSPPAYAAPGLRERWLGIAGLTLATVLAALGVLALSSREGSGRDGERRERTEGHASR